MSKKEVLINMAVGLRKKRIQGGYSSSDTFAKQHGFNPSTYQRAETGHNLNIFSLYNMVVALDARVVIDASGIRVVDK